MNAREILGLPPGSTLEEAHKKFRQLSVLYHPDKNPGNKKAADKYHEIDQAFSLIKKDPSILNESDNSPGDINLNYLRVSLNINISDVYFCRYKIIKYSRRVFCKKCEGTRTPLKNSGVCSLCNGQGTVSSAVLSIMGRSKVCPACRGSGLNTNQLCDACNGSGFENEESQQKIRITFKEYRRRMVSIKGAGNQIDKINYGPLYVKINIIEDDKISIEDNYFVVFVNILPIQKVIGDQGTVDIFGRRLIYKIDPGSDEVYIRDYLNSNFSREIRVKFIEYQVEITDETKKLYEKILKIEKKIFDARYL